MLLILMLTELILFSQWIEGGSPVEVCWHRANNGDHLEAVLFSAIDTVNKSLPAAKGRFLQNEDRMEFAVWRFLTTASKTSFPRDDRNTVRPDVSR
jgi:hypothetical protein